MLKRVLSLYRELKHYVSVLKAQSIARRMFVTNSFDGLLSALGIILGNYAYGTTSVESYIAGVIGSSFALGMFSGMIATYLSERAERLSELHRMERIMLRPLRGTVYEKAVKAVPIYVAIWSGIGAILLPLIAVAPFIAAAAAHLNASITVLAYSSTGIILVELFALGVYLGKISGENPLVSGARMTAIGAAAATVFTLANLVT